MTRVPRTAAVVFAASFGAACVLLGELIGSFGDPDEALVEHFASGSRRAADIAGAGLLAVAAIVFAVLAQRFAAHVESTEGRGSARASAVRGAGMLAAAAMLLAAVAFLAVPASITFGELVDDPGLTEGRAALPQLASVALTVGAALPTAVLVVAVGTAPAVPTWVRRSGYVVAGLLVVAIAGPPLFLLPIWFLLAVFTRPREAPMSPGREERATC